MALSLAAFAQGSVPGGQTIVVVPFENQSKAPGLEWIGESFPELLQERLTSSSMYALTRTDRMRAYERLGIPMDVHPSRATIYRIAEQMTWTMCCWAATASMDGFSAPRPDYWICGKIAFGRRCAKQAPSADKW